MASDTELLNWANENLKWSGKFGDGGVCWVDYRKGGEILSTPTKSTFREALQAAYNGETDET